MVDILRRDLTNLVVARLDLLDNLTVYQAEVPTKPPLIEVGGVPDPSGRAAPYAVVYGGAGAPDLEADLGDANIDLDWSFQVNVSAGYQESALDAIDRVHAQLYRWSPTITGLVVGKVRPPQGFNPGTIRRNDAAEPPRFWLPLLYQLPVTT